jgi:methylaspartate mutase epsilon subunit
MSRESSFGRVNHAGRIPDDVFADERREVLNSWHTGREVDIDEAVAFHRTLAPAKNFAQTIAAAYRDGRTLLWPRTGQALLDRHIEDLNTLARHGAELSATTSDSYTRTQRYADADTYMKQSEAEGRSLLNGLPVVSLGVARTRRVVQQTGLANQFRTGTPDARLSEEIVLAAGFRALQGGMLGTSVPFMKDLPVATAIRHWQYVERLVGMYQARGVDIHREYFGALMGMVMPPCIMCSSLIFDGLMAAEQGVKHITLGVNNNLHVMQDVATLRVLEKLSREYFIARGFGDVTLTPLVHMWMGQFPHAEPEAFALIGQGAITAVLGGAAAVIVKTPHEALGVPDVASNALSTRITRSIVDLMRNQRYPDSAALQREMDIIERETRAIIDTALKLGEGDVSTGVVRAYASGTMDVPFSPARGNAGKALPVRDANGAIRFLEFGNLPFDDDIKAFHRSRIRERVKRDGLEQSQFKMVIKDVSLDAFRSVELSGAAA